MPIPRVIHQTWKDRAIPEEWRDFQKTWERHHPDWTYRLWTDADLLRFVETEFPAFLATFNAYSYAIQRVDAARYLILHRYGGVYADLDIECLRPLDPLLKERDFAIAAEPAIHAQWVGAERLLCNAFMASAPRHPFLSAIVAELGRTEPRILLHSEVLTTTGPAMVARVARAFGLDETCVLDAATVYPFASNSSELNALRSGARKPVHMRNEALRRGAYAIHYWSNTWVKNLAGALRNPRPHDVPGYLFHPGRDSVGFDIGNVGRDIEVLARECTADARAVAFNTDGFLKHELRPAAQWTHIDNADGNEGLYVKIGP